jgi:hypothetical protein
MMYTPQTEEVPKPGEWPVDPQEAAPLSEDRIWIDGCFDFAHHGASFLAGTRHCCCVSLGSLVDHAV